MASSQFLEPVTEPYASGVEVEDLHDGNLRFTLYVRRGEESVFVDSYVMAAGAAVAAAREIMTTLGYRCCGAVREGVH